MAGVLFDANSTISRTALTYGIEKYNNNSSSEIRIDPYEKQVDLTNTVDLTEKGDVITSRCTATVSVYISMLPSLC